MSVAVLTFRRLRSLAERATVGSDEPMELELRPPAAVRVDNLVKLITSFPDVKLLESAPIAE